MDASFDLFDFSRRISSVTKGLWGPEEQVTVLRGGMFIKDRGEGRVEFASIRLLCISR